MWKWIKCALGLHDWRYYTRKVFGEELKLRECRRCVATQCLRGNHWIRI